jgi:hypothetical protein
MVPPQNCNLGRNDKKDIEMSVLDAEIDMKLVPDKAS